MSVKTKIISLVLLFLLVLPFFTSSLNQGSVLGVNENAATGNLGTGDGQIAGGVIENKTNSKDSTDKAVLKGLAVLDKQATTSVLSKDFALASEITVTNGTKTADLIVSKVDQSLASDTVLILDEITFKSLGGDPKTQEKLEVSVKYAK
jgi:hypothetical protein